MKNAIFALALAAVAVSCTQASEEATVETTNDSTTVQLDSLEEASYDVEGVEASAE
jgi:hypothetical protein